MARLAYLDRDDLPELERDILMIFSSNAARLAISFGSWRTARCSCVACCTSAMGCGIGPRSILACGNFAIMTVGRLTDCEYEYTHHKALAQRVGVSPAQVEKLADWKTSPAFNEHERSVIRYATEMTRQVQIADTTFDALRAFLNEEQIVELSLNTAFYNMVVRFPHSDPG